MVITQVEQEDEKDETEGFIFFVSSVLTWVVHLR